MTFTVMVLVPCCEITEPDYDPGPRPVWNRIPGGWPPRCTHQDKREAVISTHEAREAAGEVYGEWAPRGWKWSTDGYLHEGPMPPEGERFRIMPIIGGSGSGFHRHAKPWEIPFPTVDLAREYAERFAEYTDGESRQYQLYHVVGDRDTRVRWSATGMKLGTELYAGDAA